MLAGVGARHGWHECGGGGGGCCVMMPTAANTPCSSSHACGSTHTHTLFCNRLLRMSPKVPTFYTTFDYRYIYSPLGVQLKKIMTKLCFIFRLSSNQRFRGVSPLFAEPRVAMQRVAVNQSQLFVKLNLQFPLHASESRIG